MRRFELPAGPARERGRAHGEAFRGEIGSLAEIRLYLCAHIAGGSRAEVLELAARHLPVLKAFDADLHDELCGIAEGAAVDPAAIVVLNHYTDLRDIALSGAAGPASADGCSVLYARTPAGPVAAQTWDMHATAASYVMMLRDPGEGDRPAAWLLSLTGCLGMAGMNSRGVALCINNLASSDAQVGAVWPALVRRALSQQSAAAARDLLLEAPIGSGRHYLVADPAAAFALETSGTRRTSIYADQPGDDGDDEGGGAAAPAYVHTNHCIDPTIAAHTRVAEGSTTFDRFAFLKDRLDRIALRGPDDAWQLLGSHQGYPRSVCTNMATAENPHAPATCAGIVMTPESGQILACAGFTHGVRPEVFES